MRIAVLASGSGTNLQSLIDAAARGGLQPATIAVVGANVPGCGALGRAHKAGIPTFIIDHHAFPGREAFDYALVNELKNHQIELVVLAGFMRVLTPVFLDAYPERVINIHPALLPAFPGTHAQKQAFDYGAKLSGCTVHFVDKGTDTGPIIAQSAVPVLESDTEGSLRLRILNEEHLLLPSVIRAIAQGRVCVEGRRVRITHPNNFPEQRLRSIEPV
jgi:phosphoribosylglycinamide formyltransferase-1